MMLSHQDGLLYFKLHWNLMYFVNQRLKVIPDDVSSPEEFAVLPAEVRVKVRDALLENIDLLQAFAEENPAALNAEELDIVLCWRHFVAGKFWIFRKLKKHTIFLACNLPKIPYGVVALSQPLEDLIGPALPVLAHAVLLPFKDKIVYDGILLADRISFGGGVKRMLNETYKETKFVYGVVTSLPRESVSGAQPQSPRTPAKRPKTKSRPNADAKAKAKEATAQALAHVTDLITQFCHEYLTDEYREVCIKLANKLARKRPSPLLSGSPNSWAAGIVRTIGSVNFLFDPSQELSILASTIDECFSVSKTTGSSKASAIRKMFRIGTFDPNWTLPSRIDDNPMVWTFEVNGLPMDIRHAPRAIQEMAFKKGLIPYIPADR